MREKHRGASEARAELLKLGITDDPNDPENRRRIFKKRFPSMVKASHTRGRYGDGDHPSVRKDSSYEFVSKDASMDTSKLAGPWSTADAAFESASRSAAASPADRAVGASVDAHAVRFASAAASSGLLSTGAADACAARACAVSEPNADHSCAIRFECDPSVLSRSARAASLI